MNIIIDDLRGPEIAALLQEHLDDMQSISPPESCHALDLEKLRHPSVTFWTAWDGTNLMGCGALKKIDAEHAEVKSMRTAKPYLRKGVAQRILETVITGAREQGFKRLSLETGTQPEFEAARLLYERNEFVYVGPFEGYREDPLSAFMSRGV